MCKLAAFWRKKHPGILAFNLKVCFNGAMNKPIATKQAAIAVFGSMSDAAKAIGISSQAINCWPDILPPRILDRVIAACVRDGIEVPAHFLKKSDGSVRDEYGRNK